MLYSEFLKGTRAPETPDTYDQFQIIGQIYEDCEGMTKEEAYRIWKQTYGRELKRRELRQRERLELLINREDYDSADRPHRAAIYHELSTLFWAAYYNKDGSRCRLATEGRCFTDVYGITWILRYDGRYPNGNTIFNAGVFYLNGNNPRSNSNDNIGFRPAYYPAYMLTLTTACRRGEILGLDWQHVDIGIPWTTVDRYFPWGDIKKLPKWDTKALKTLLEDHNITLGDGYLRLVYQMVDDNGTPFRDELKTDLSRRSLMITEEMVLLLIFWRLLQNTEKRKAAERGIEYNPDNLVFCTRKGTYIYPRNFTKMWSENLRSMGIDHKRFHDLRHTVATVMLEDGEAMNTVQEQLGHYDAGFTASRYGHVTAKMRNSAAVKLGERLEKVRNPEAEDAEDANSVKNEDTVIPFQEGRKLKSAACKIK